MCVNIAVSDRVNAGPSLLHFPFSQPENKAAVDGRKPFRTALKPEETMVCWYLCWEISFLGFFRWCGFWILAMYG